MKLTTEQLLKLVEEHKDVPNKQKSSFNDVHNFISDLNIKEGKHKVHTKMIYKTYRLWSSNPYKTKTFFTSFSKYFKRYNIHNWHYYNLNYSAVGLLNKVDNSLIKV